MVKKSKDFKHLPSHWSSKSLVL